MFTAVSTCVFLILFGLFDSKSGPNLFLKFSFLALGIWGISIWLGEGL